MMIPNKTVKKCRKINYSFNENIEISFKSENNNNRTNGKGFG